MGLFTGTTSVTDYWSNYRNDHRSHRSCCGLLTLEISESHHAPNTRMSLWTSESEDAKGALRVLCRHSKVSRQWMNIRTVLIQRMWSNMYDNSSPSKLLYAKVSRHIWAISSNFQSFSSDFFERSLQSRVEQLLRWFLEYSNVREH